MIEAAIILPLVLLLIIGIIDFGRILAVRGILTTGAYNGCNLAAKIPGLELDDRLCADQNPPNPPACDDGTQIANQGKVGSARASVIARARELPLATLLTDNTPSMAVLTDTFHLRPGDSSFTDSKGEVFTHFDCACRDRVSTSPGNCPIFPPDPGADPPIPFNGYEQMNFSCPHLVGMLADVDTFIPGIGTLRVAGNAACFREITLSGSFPAYNPPPPTTTTSSSTSTTSSSSSSSSTTSSSSSTTSTTSSTSSTTSTTSSTSSTTSTTSSTTSTTSTTSSTTSTTSTTSSTTSTTSTTSSTSSTTSTTSSTTSTTSTTSSTTSTTSTTSSTTST
ncbi:MAG: pilus assembly protein, partial [Bdellovibrionales bacterium]|nr:pilus assembly protein [Bdellovibrionales bacterium]